MTFLHIFFTWNNCLIINFGKMILRKINFGIIFCNICNYSLFVDIHLIILLNELRFHECCHSCFLNSCYSCGELILLNGYLRMNLKILLWYVLKYAFSNIHNSKTICMIKKRKKKLRWTIIITIESAFLIS